LRAVDYFSATHYLRNAPTARISADTVSVSRERFVDESVTEHVIVHNEGMTALEFELDLELAADFADILSVADSTPYAKACTRRSESRGVLSQTKTRPPGDDWHNHRHPYS
jgi:hypothetical protein